MSANQFMQLLAIWLALIASFHAHAQPVLSAPPSAPITNGRPDLRVLFRNEIERRDVPLQFYGKVIDQSSNALAGVRITAEIVQVTIPDSAILEIGERNVSIERITGSDGRFEIIGTNGSSFDLKSVQKDGYEVEPVKRGHGSKEGTLEEPVVFKMWSTNIHEPLIIFEKSVHIVPDGRAYFLDLHTGTINESGPGDLRLWVQYTNQPISGQRYDWKASIEVQDGGLVEATNIWDSMFWAPNDGYVSSFHFREQIKGGQSGEIGDRRFYLRLKNGKEYGRMSINLYAPYGFLAPGLIRFSYAVNPSGSRILR